MADSIKGKVYRILHAIVHDGQRLEPGTLIKAGEHMAEEAVERLLGRQFPALKEHKPGAAEEEVSAAPAAPQRRAAPAPTTRQIERVPAGEE